VTANKNALLRYPEPYASLFVVVSGHHNGISTDVLQKHTQKFTTVITWLLSTGGRRHVVAINF
jgi:hypothetical protein